MRQDLRGYRSPVHQRMHAHTLVCTRARVRAHACTHAHARQMDDTMASAAYNVNLPPIPSLETARSVRACEPACLCLCMHVCRCTSTGTCTDAQTCTVTHVHAHISGADARGKMNSDGWGSMVFASCYPHRGSRGPHRCYCCHRRTRFECVPWRRYGPSATQWRRPAQV